MTEDFYDLLEVPRDASEDEIRNAFREQVRVYHPDRNDDDRAQAQFTALKKAYDILGDPVERQAYDRLGHHEYVRKRTSGLPSPDLWQRHDEDERESDDSESREQTIGPTSGTSASTKRTRSKRKTSAGIGGGANPSSSTGSAGSSGGVRSGDAASKRTHRRSVRTGGPPSWLVENFVFDRIRRTLVPTRLLWLSVFCYVMGLGHFAMANVSGLETTTRELLDAGTDPGAVLSVLTVERYSIDQPGSFVLTAQPMAPPIEPTAWTGVLFALAVLPVLLVLTGRIVWREETWGPISLEETILVATAAGFAGVLGGGPLLAGVVLMPLLFGVIVRRTRQSMGWTPSYSYVLAVSIPATALIVERLGLVNPTLAFDLVAYVVVPLVGAIGLPLRVELRRRFDR